MKAFTLNALIAIIGRLPLPIRSRLGRLLGYLASLVPTRSREVAMLQADLFIPEAGGKRLCPKMYASMGQTVCESLRLEPMLAFSDRYLTIHDEAELDAILREPRGTVALTAHTGNWDLMAAYFCHRGVPITAVGREARSPLLQDLLISLRTRYGIETLWRSDRAGVASIVRVLKNKKTVAALIDQDTRVASLNVPFFGRSARTPSSLVALAKRFDAQIVTSFIFRTGPNRYTIFVERIDDSLDVHDTLACYNLRLEALIRHYPEQWVWLHKRWRGLPTGEILSSSAYIDELKRLLDDSTSCTASHSAHAP